MAKERNQFLVWTQTLQLNLFTNKDSQLNCSHKIKQGHS